MNAARLLALFERVADAPDAIERLRRFILDLAVRGKLVPQDPKDEPASELLKRITAAKEKNGRPVRSRRDSLVVASDAVIPSGWALVPLSDLVSVLNGRAYKQSELLDHGTPVLRVGNLFTSDKWYYSDLRLEEDKYCDRGDLIFAWSASFGPFIWTGDRVIYHYHIWKLPLHSEADLDKRYLYDVLLEKTREIKEAGHGVSMIHMTKEKMERIDVPLPPLAEQRRIVAKVDELLALCDRLEATRAEREVKRERLAAASFARLNTPDPDKATFVSDARFALDTLPALTARTDQIKQLRQTILNLAMSGRLVPQRPNDQPASEVLARKAQLPDGHRRRRKILKTKSAQVQGPFSAIPQSWEYATIQDLYDLNVIIDYADGNHGSLYPRSSEFGTSGVSFVTARDLTGGRVTWTTCAKLNEVRARQLTKGWAEGGDVLLTHNATVGRVARVEAGVDPFLLGTSVTFYRLNTRVLDPEFFFRVLESSLWQEQLRAIMAQTTRNQVSIQKQAVFRVVVPPMPEQRRIVAKVDDLMTLCDRLEASLSASDTTRARLLDALLADALAPVASELQVTNHSGVHLS